MANRKEHSVNLLMYSDAANIVEKATKIFRDEQQIEAIQQFSKAPVRNIFAATMALQNGVDIRTVSGMLGHADPGFTLRTYTHTNPKMQEQAAATVGQVMAQNI